MTHVTITDHDTIGGCLEIAHLPNTFISCEITARFPDDQCRVHVLTYNITEEQFEEIDDLRKNIYELTTYLQQNGIWHAIAHPFYSVNNKLTQDHFEQLLVIFDLFELNGFRSKPVNDKVKFVVDNISSEKLQELANKHNIRNPKVIPQNKAFVCGSDDHSGLYIARSYTYNPAGTIDGFFTDTRANGPALLSAGPVDLGYAIYSTVYHSIESRFDVDKYIQMDDALKNISAFMTMKQSRDRTPFYSLDNSMLSHSEVKRGDVESQLRHIFRGITISSGDLSLEKAGDQWFKIISGAINQSMKDLLEYTVEQVKKGNIFNIFRAIGSISALYFLCIPYYISFRIFQATKSFADSVNIINAAERPIKVAHFTDTYHEVNGVALTLRQMAKCAHKFGLDYEFIICDNASSMQGEKVFDPVTVFDLPEYPELKLSFPPILEVLDYVYRKDVTHIHSATPGPVGLTGLLVAKLLKKQFYATYHTAVPQYVGRLTEDPLLEHLAWKYIAWFYNMADKVFVPSQAFVAELLEKGIRSDKVALMPRGIDTERFSFKNGNGHHAGYNLLYVGRISKEKNLHILAEAFKLLNRDDTSLTLVGDGPYRDELEEALKGFNVQFSGYLTGNMLVKAYHDSDLFVFPSTTDTFGNVILEAHSCGLPTITTDVGGPCESVMQGETGLIVKGNDVVALKAGIESLLDKKKLGSMGKRAREIVEHRSFEAAFLKFWSFYKNGNHEGEAS
jgi:glycosyltransferase involved in cell wall biosynthesis/predicted metal-dependent phosphoesterase TrpH